MGIPASAFVVGCISRFHHKKRNDVVIDAVSRLDGDSHLILAGSGDTEAELRQRAASLGERAHFVPTPGAAVGEVLSAFDVSVFCPSPTEGAPRAVILGMLADAPSFATGAEGVADLLADDIGGIVVPENDAEALAERLEPYRGDEDRRRREGELARRPRRGAVRSPGRGRAGGAPVSPKPPVRDDGRDAARARPTARGSSWRRTSSRRRCSGGYEVECATSWSTCAPGIACSFSPRPRARRAADGADVIRRLPFVGPSRARSLLAPLDALRGARTARRVLDSFEPDLVYVWNGASIPQAALRVIRRAAFRWPIASASTGSGASTGSDRFMRHLTPGERGLRGVWARPCGSSTGCPASGSTRAARCRWPSAGTARRCGG